MKAVRFLHEVWLRGHVVGVCRKCLPKSQTNSGTASNRNKALATNGKPEINKGKGRMEYRPRTTDIPAQKINQADAPQTNMNFWSFRVYTAQVLSYLS